MFRKRLWIPLLLVAVLVALPLLAAGQASTGHSTPNLSARLIGPEGGYHSEVGMNPWEIICSRAVAHPFHILSAACFLLAIFHTFFANNFTALAHTFAEKHRKKREKMDVGHRFELEENLGKDVSFRAEICHFLGEIEVIFGLWVMPLLIVTMFWFDWNTAISYLDTRNYTEPLFVVVIMSIAATRPVIKFTEACLSFVAGLGGGTVASWWLTILIIGPLLGSLITEPGAMTISALLLARRFYKYEPSLTLKYATLGLLFVNISVGGVLTHFAAPPVLMVAGLWGWDTPFMLANFGWKAALGICFNTLAYFLFFRKDFAALTKKAKADDKKGAAGPAVPIWITAAHLLLLFWTVLHAHHPVVFIGSFLLFLGFYQATAPHQTPFTLRPALLVGFFLAGLVIHGGLQGWWIGPILQGVSTVTLNGIAIVLTAFNDNAAVTYLTTLIPNFSDPMKYAVVAGAVTGGGLTVIANAPNPAGQSLLVRYFEGGISPLKLAAGAMIPTIVMAFFFMLL